MSLVNHYDTLEVSPKASFEVIRAAYKSLMQRNHPDKQLGAGTDTAIAVRIAQAYGVLSDPVQRAAYDLQLQSQLALFASRSPTITTGPDTTAVLQSGVPRARQGTTAKTKGKGWQLWYAWGLIAIILLTGSALLMQPKKRGALPQLAPSLAGPTGQPPSTSMARSALAPPPDTPQSESPEQLRARTVLPYALDLSVALAPSRPGAPGNLLSIAELGLRVGTDEPQRWILKIEAQRQDILRLILLQLATTRAEDLASPEADIYLKGLIAGTVANAINLPIAPASGPSVAHPIEVLLPQGFRLQ